jgi:hypothetical protein
MNVRQIETERHDRTIFKPVDLGGWTTKLIHVEMQWLNDVEIIGVFEESDRGDLS